MITNDTYKIIEKLQNQLELKEKQLSKALDKVGNNNTINNIENQQINIQINGFGNEVTDYITPEYILFGSCLPP